MAKNPVSLRAVSIFQVCSTLKTKRKAHNARSAHKKGFAPPATPKVEQVVTSWESGAHVPFLSEALSRIEPVP